MVDLWEESGFDRLAIGIELALGASKLAAEEGVCRSRMPPGRLTTRDTAVFEFLVQSAPNKVIAHKRQ
jgi:hypothetical protein